MGSLKKIATLRNQWSPSSKGGGDLAKRLVSEAVIESQQNTKFELRFINILR